MSIRCKRKLSDLAKSNGLQERRVINIVPPTLTPDIQLIVIQQPHINFWEKRDESQNDVLYISAHKQSLTDNIPYFEAAFRDSSNWIDSESDNLPPNSKRSKTGCGSSLQTYKMIVPFKPERLAEYLKRTLHDEYLYGDDDYLGDYLSISSYLSDKSVYDDLLKMVENNLYQYSYIEYFNVQVSINDEDKAFQKIIDSLVDCLVKDAVALDLTGKNAGYMDRWEREKSKTSIYESADQEEYQILNLRADAMKNRSWNE